MVEILFSGEKSATLLDLVEAVRAASKNLEDFRKGVAIETRYPVSDLDDANSALAEFVSSTVLGVKA
jgi:hypothetical protein